jgi:hypothetical protein
MFRVNMILSTTACSTNSAFGKGSAGNGWYSYNHKGVHFVGLNNCVKVDAMGNMGDDQLSG